MKTRFDFTEEMTIQIASASPLEIGEREVNIIGGEAGVGRSIVGKFVFTDGIGSCQAVVAVLSSGAFVLYHAQSPFSSNRYFKEFVEQIKAEEKEGVQLEEVYIFQKEKNLSNKKKAPILTLELKNALNIDPIRVSVNGHQAVVCDSIENRVVLTNKLKREVSKKSEQSSIHSISAPIQSLSENIRRCIPLEETIKEVVAYNQYVSPSQRIKLSEEQQKIVSQLEESKGAEKENKKSSH